MPSRPQPAHEPTETRHWVELIAEGDLVDSRLVCESPKTCTTQRPEDRERHGAYCNAGEWVENTAPAAEMLLWPRDRRDVVGRFEVGVEWNGEDSLGLTPIDSAAPDQPISVGSITLGEQIADALNEQWPHLLNDGLKREVADAALSVVAPLLASKDREIQGFRDIAATAADAAADANDAAEDFRVERDHARAECARINGLLGERGGTIHTEDTLKTIRETLCVAQTAIHSYDQASDGRHRAILGRLIADIDRQRPLDTDGVHAARGLCTTTCGCELDQKGKPELAELAGRSTLSAPARETSDNARYLALVAEHGPCTCGTSSACSEQHDPNLAQCDLCHLLDPEWPCPNLDADADYPPTGETEPSREQLGDLTLKASEVDSFFAGQGCPDNAPEAAQAWTAPPCQHDHPLALAVRDAMPEADPWLPGEIAAAVQALSDRGGVPEHGRVPAEELADRIRELLDDQTELIETRSALSLANTLIEKIKAHNQRRCATLTAARDRERASRQDWAAHADDLAARFAEELACECNGGGKPCECPDCECLDCSYQQPDSAPVDPGLLRQIFRDETAKLHPEAHNG